MAARPAKPAAAASRPRGVDRGGGGGWPCSHACRQSAGCFDVTPLVAVALTCSTE